MSTNGMTIERFAAILAAYGAQPARWPAGERAAAVELAGRDPAARALHAEAAAVDDWLDSAEMPAPSPGLADRILATFPAAAGQPAPQTRGRAAPLTGALRRLWDSHVWQPAAALGLSAALGLAVGLGPASALAADLFIDEPFAIAWQGDDLGAWND